MYTLQERYFNPLYFYVESHSIFLKGQFKYALYFRKKFGVQRVNVFVLCFKAHKFGPAKGLRCSQVIIITAFPRLSSAGEQRSGFT